VARRGGARLIDDDPSRQSGSSMPCRAVP